MAAHCLFRIRQGVRSPLQYIGSTCPLCRYKSSKPPKDIPSSYVKPIAGIGQYVTTKFRFFLSGYDKFLKKFPVAYRLHQMFLVGTRDLLTGIKDYMRISQELRMGKSVRELSRKELDLYYRIPKDMIKVAPTLVIIALPGTNFFMFPLIYWFPRQLLTWHFWSLEQRVEFSVIAQRKKVSHFRSVFRQLQAAVPKGDEGKEPLAVFHKLGSGTHPTVEEVIHMKPFFEGKPYGLDELSRKHLTGLCKINGISSFFIGRRYRLWKHGGFVREMDKAMEREGVETMDMADLRSACFLRGLNPVGLNKKELVQWLQNWIRISAITDGSSISLLLHCPIFLGYNYPSNWILIH
ncbi:LETM1 domain-containing protein 1-like [Ornithodoros turicata]|uniref:LETM1 domain-containing protein 1-like n=1 Tax=Ornithodoros turicata TaxID=34597 RepID=UPI00313902DD